MTFHTVRIRADGVSYDAFVRSGLPEGTHVATSGTDATELIWNVREAIEVATNSKDFVVDFVMSEDVFDQLATAHSVPGKKCGRSKWVVGVIAALVLAAGVAGSPKT